MNTKETEYVSVPLSEGELERIKDGKSFNWKFKTDKGTSVLINLRPEDQRDIS